jgi:hypothetical protein
MAKVPQLEQIQSISITTFVELQLSQEQSTVKKLFDNINCFQKNALQRSAKE